MIKVKDTMQSSDIAGDVVVVTSTYVINDGLPIIYVSHEFDEVEGVIWQFHAGNNDYDMDKMLLVSLNSVLEMDASINELSSLPLNYVARRKSIGDSWTFSEE
ncbi:hypothetical protein [Vibrio caribbeanicus]|uniref:hypothetical protein n=1 Tax=Vibrio caribbeanicus TaxID=701175 RepID=UPI0030DDDA5F